MNKKGQGLSLTTIVIAAIALLVLVILSVVFIGRMGGFAGEVDLCQNKGGQCYDEVEYPNCPTGFTKHTWTCESEGQVCCLAVS